MRTLILGLLALCISASGYAQFSKAKLQASGLTCAMCARSVYKNLEALPFVDSIGTDLGRACVMLSRHRAHLTVVTDAATPAVLRVPDPDPSTLAHRHLLDALLG